MTEQEVKTAIELDPSRVISVSEKIVIQLKLVLE